jgi:hypothetical protein
VPVAILVLFLGLLFAVSALRDRWRMSKSTGQFLGDCFGPAAVATAIIVAFLLPVFLIAR